MTRGKRSGQPNLYSRKKQKTSNRGTFVEDDPSLSLLIAPSTSKSRGLPRKIKEALKSNPGDDHHNYIFELVTLPHLILVNIVDNLSVSDVCRLSCVNKYLRDFIKSNYITRVTLSGPTLPSSGTPSSLEAVPSKNILSLNLTLSLSQLPTDLFTYQPFARLNLRKLKHLKVTGRNHIWNKQYLLSDVYKNTMERLLSQVSYKHHLTQLEFLVDESKRSVDIVKLARHFPNLIEVTLHGIGYFDTGSYHMDKDVAQNIISGILCNSTIKTLRLKSFDTLHRCIVIESDSLEELHAEFGKHFEIGLFYLPNVLHISLETSVWAGCFYHAQNGELKKIVAQGCPRLQTFNSIKLWELSARSESRHWIQELGEHCAAGQTESHTQCLLCVNKQEI